MMAKQQASKEKFTAGQKGQSKGAAKRTREEHNVERYTATCSKFATQQKIAAGIRNTGRTPIDSTNDNSQSQGKVRRIFAQVMMETGVRAVIRQKGDQLKELSPEQLHTGREQNDGLRIEAPTEISQSTFHGRTKPDRLPGLPGPPGLTRMPHATPPNNVLTKVWNGQALEDHGPTLRLITTGAQKTTTSNMSS